LPYDGFAEAAGELFPLSSLSHDLDRIPHLFVGHDLRMYVRENEGQLSDGELRMTNGAIPLQ
jgi:hypothetical protein